jgi:hypothetical protein
VSYLDDRYDESLLFDRVDNSIVALANAVPVLAGELLTTVRSGLVSEFLNPLDDASAIGAAGDGFDFFDR